MAHSGFPNTPTPTSPTIRGGGAPAAATTGDVSPAPSGGDVHSRTVGTSNITDLFAELDLLRTQATNIQAQLDGQRAVSADFAWSIKNMQNEIQTLRDASTLHSDLIGHAIKTAAESHERMMEFKTIASDLTYKFHTVSTTVDDFIARQPTTTTTPPPPLSSTIDEAFAAADAALSDGIASMQNEVSDRLDREIAARSHTNSTPGGRFTQVEDRWKDQEPYDSEATYAAAHAPSPQPSNPDSTTAGGFSTQTQHSSTDTHRNTSPRGTYGDSLSPRFNGPTSPRY